MKTTNNLTMFLGGLIIVSSVLFAGFYGIKLFQALDSGNFDIMASVFLSINLMSLVLGMNIVRKS